jgi:hypothetical protein
MTSFWQAAVLALNPRSPHASTLGSEEGSRLLAEVLIALFVCVAGYRPPSINLEMLAYMPREILTMPLLGTVRAGLH